MLTVLAYLCECVRAHLPVYSGCGSCCRLRVTGWTRPRMKWMIPGLSDWSRTRNSADSERGPHSLRPDACAETLRPPTRTTCLHTHTQRYHKNNTSAQWNYHYKMSEDIFFFQIENDQSATHNLKQAPHLATKETSICHPFVTNRAVCIDPDSCLWHATSPQLWSLSCGQKGEQKASGRELATHQEGCSSPQRRGRRQIDA